MNEQGTSRWMAVATTLLSILLVGGMSSGCGSGRNDLQRMGIRGSVTHKQQPVVRGVISLKPSQGTVGPASGTIVNNGSYEIRPDRGPAVGNYRAELKIMTSEQETPPHPERVGTKPALPFQTYVIPIEVKNGNNVINFELPPATPKVTGPEQ